MEEFSVGCCGDGVNGKHKNLSKYPVPLRATPFICIKSKFIINPLSNKIFKLMSFTCIVIKLTYNSINWEIKTTKYVRGYCKILMKKIFFNNNSNNNLFLKMFS